MDKKLTEKQKRFADYYIETGNGTEAAIKAGYSENTAKEIASENLTKPNIKNYIDKLLQKKDHSRIASQDEVLEYLTNVMRGKVQEEQVVVESVGDYMSAARKIKKQVSPKDRNKAAELLGKRYRLFVDKKEIEGNLNTVILDDLEEVDGSES